MTIDTDGTYIITQTNPETPTTNTITVSPGVTATVTLKDVNIDATNNSKCAFDMHGEDGRITKVTIILDGNNSLKSGRKWAGIFTGPYGDLTIKDTESGGGCLLAVGSLQSAGIGGSAGEMVGRDYQFLRAHGGTIRIEGGNITATAGAYAAGIGDGDYSWNRTYTSSASITITGGTITITPPGYNSKAGCLGCGDDNITSGCVMVLGGQIIFPDIERKNNSYIRTGTVVFGSNAEITYSNVETPNKIVYNEGSIIFNDEATAEVKGNPILSESMKIPEGATLTIPNGTSLTIQNGVTLTVEGTLTNNGKICNDGTIIGPYSGTVQSKLKRESIVLSDNSFTYDGNEQKYTSITVKKGESDNYAESTDYTVTYANNINAGEGKATVKIKMNDSDVDGALYGEVTIPFSIEKAEAPAIAAFNLISPIEYNGQPVEITAPVVTGVNLSNVPATLYYKLTAAENDTYTKTAPTEAGEYTVKAVCESPNHEEATAQTTTFSITKAASNNWKDGSRLTSTEFAYGLNGYPTIEPVYGVVTYTYYKETEESGNYTLLEEKPTDVGTWYITAQVLDTESYPAVPETDKVQFTIIKATDNAWTTPLSDVATPWTYGEDGNYPTAVAKYGTVLYKYYDYDAVNAQYIEVSGKPINVGTWYVKAYVEDTDNFNGLPLTDPKKFTIVAKELTASMITLSSEEYTYTGYKPTITVKYGEATLVENTDYTVTWPDNAAGVGTHTVTITGIGNFTGPIEKSYTINSRPYIPPTPDPDPVYYTVTIPTEVTGAIIHGGGTHEVEEYTYCSFRIELDPNGNGEYPTVTKGYWWDTLTPDGQGNYSVYVTGDTQITIGEVPTNSYDYYQVTLPTDSVAEADDQYWSGDYIEVTGASPLRAAEEASLSYQASFGATVTLRPIETERRKFLQWEDGSKQKERTLTLRADQAIKALWQRISPTGIEAIAAGSVIRGDRGQLYIEVPEPCDVTLYTYGGVPVRVARLAAGANRLANLNAGLYLVKIGGAQAVPVRVR